MNREIYKKSNRNDEKSENRSEQQMKTIANVLSEDKSGDQ